MAQAGAAAGAAEAASAGPPPSPNPILPVILARRSLGTRGCAGAAGFQQVLHICQPKCWWFCTCTSCV